MRPIRGCSAGAESTAQFHRAGGPAREGDEKPDYEQPAVESAEGAVERGIGRAEGAQRRSRRARAGESRPHWNDEPAKAGNAGGKEGGAAEEGPGGSPGLSNSEIATTLFLSEGTVWDALASRKVCVVSADSASTVGSASPW
jgi:hypothetical protein